MGTYYTIGIITEFGAVSKGNLTIDTWKEILRERIDLDLFDITVDDSTIRGKIKKEFFIEHIADFYNVLRKMCGPEYNRNIDYYEKEYGTNIDEYQIQSEKLFVEDKNKNTIKLETNFAMLMLEGKVLAEEFYTAPHVTNWLFRNSNIANKLSGAVISSVVG